MDPADLALYTRGLIASPVALIKPPPQAETFEWVQQPADGVVSGKFYVDGSRIDGEPSLAGMCARHGWAFAAYDDDGTLLAAARGRPLAWAEGIHGAELWALVMAATSSVPWSPLRVDCLSVQHGTQKGRTWAETPERRLARVWDPLNATLDDDPTHVVWMPAHCRLAAVGERKLGNGEVLTALDRTGNAFVDQLAKEAAKFDRLPLVQREMVRERGEVLTAVATWIGQATQLANHFPDPRWAVTGRRQWLQDSEGQHYSHAAKTGGQSSGTKRRQHTAMSNTTGPGEPHGLTDDWRREALRQRISDKVSCEAAGCTKEPCSSKLLQVVAEPVTHEDPLNKTGHKRPALPYRRRQDKRQQLSAERSTGQHVPAQVAELQAPKADGERVEPVVRCGPEDPEDAEAGLAVALRDFGELQASGCHVR